MDSPAACSSQSTGADEDIANGQFYIVFILPESPVEEEEKKRSRLWGVIRP